MNSTRCVVNTVVQGDLPSGDTQIKFPSQENHMSTTPRQSLIPADEIYNLIRAERRNVTGSVHVDHTAAVSHSS